MKLFIIIALALFWVVLAIGAFQRGDTGLAAIFLLAGTALTIYRLRR